MGYLIIESVGAKKLLWINLATSFILFKVGDFGQQLCILLLAELPFFKLVVKIDVRRRVRLARL
jgi:hypothetical protein